MDRKPRSLVRGIAAVVLAGSTAAPSSAADPPGPTDEAIAQKAEALQQDMHTQVLGNPRGDVTIVEFFDYACPFCKAAEPRVEALLQSDKGVRLVVKEFPILTPQSLVATKVALAAARQGKYAEFHQALMSFRGPLTEPVIFATAAMVGLNVARLRRDMTAPEINDEIYANLNLARSLRIFATPAFIVGDHMLTEPSAQIDFPKVVADARRGGA